MYKRVLNVVVFLLISHLLFSQSNLNKVISLDVKLQRIDKVLEILSNKGNFYFSYNSSIVKRDSVVTISEKDKTVKQLLEIIFRQQYEFVETGNYIIIRKAPLNLSINTIPSEVADKFYQVSGFVYDEESGDGVGDASIYERKILASALTSANGYFRLRIKSHKHREAELTVSKEFYRDTVVTVPLDKPHQLNITIAPERYVGQLITVSPGDLYISDSIKVRVEIDPDHYKIIELKADTIRVEETGLSKFLLSSRQKIQSINLRKFFTERPFQLSLTPGLSTMGDLSPQIVTKYSLNVFGGYTGGVNGVEIGGLFNMNKKDVKYFQAGGIFN
ncbi:MAG TPA: hypothetical protein VIK74_07140, partial [Parasegetibacter sp.]